MREGMRSDICAVYVEIWQERRYRWKHNRIAPFYYQHVSTRWEEAKYISI